MIGLKVYFLINLLLTLNVVFFKKKDIKDMLKEDNNTLVIEMVGEKTFVAILIAGLMLCALPAKLVKLFFGASE